MDSGAEYINVTFRGMEMAFNIAGKPLGAALRAIKLILSGIAHSAKESIDYARDKDGVKSAAELRKLQYKRSKPIAGEVAINEITDRYGADFALLQLPIAHDEKALADFERSVREKGLCFARAKDFNTSDNVIQIVIPMEQKVGYQAFFEVLNQDLMPEVDKKIKDYMQKNNELESAKNEIRAKVKFLMQQRLKEGVSQEDLDKLDLDIENYQKNIEGLNREIHHIDELKKTVELAKYTEIDPDIYAASAAGKSAEAFERDGDLQTLECGGLHHYTARGFEGESFNNETDYLMNVGCSDIYIERKRYINNEGRPEYSFALYDKGVKLDNGDFKLNIYTSDKDIEAFESTVMKYVHQKNTELSKGNTYTPDSQDCNIFEKIEDIDILSKKMNNFEAYVKAQSEKKPSNGFLNSEVEEALKQKAQKDEYIKNVNMRATGANATIPIEFVITEDEYVKIANERNEYIDIPKSEVILNKKFDNEIELIIAEPDKLRPVYSNSKSGEVQYETSFAKFGKSYTERFEEIHKTVTESIEEIKRNVSDFMSKKDLRS